MVVIALPSDRQPRPAGGAAPAATRESLSEDNRVVDEIALDVERLP